jgi:hypothetical protein
MTRQSFSFSQAVSARLATATNHTAGQFTLPFGVVSSGGRRRFTSLSSNIGASNMKTSLAKSIRFGGKLFNIDELDSYLFGRSAPAHIDMHAQGARLAEAYHLILTRKKRTTHTFTGAEAAARVIPDTHPES